MRAEKSSFYALLQVLPASTAFGCSRAEIILEKLWMEAGKPEKQRLPHP